MSNNLSNPKLEDVLSDTLLLHWLNAHLEWDGHGFWLPEICIREVAAGQNACPEPTMAEFRAALSDRVRASAKNSGPH